MGFNSVAFFCNDAFGAVDKDPEEFWKRLKENLARPDESSSVKGDFGFGCHANGFQAVWNQHADVVAVIVAGENYAEVAATFMGAYRGEDRGDRNLLALKALAHKPGYDIRKKPKKGKEKK